MFYIKDSNPAMYLSLTNSTLKIIWVLSSIHHIKVSFNNYLQFPSLIQAKGFEKFTFGLHKRVDVWIIFIRRSEGFAKVRVWLLQDNRQLVELVQNLLALIGFHHIQAFCFLNNIGKSCCPKFQYLDYFE